MKIFKLVLILPVFLSLSFSIFQGRMIYGEDNGLMLSYNQFITNFPTVRCKWDNQPWITKHLHGKIISIGKSGLAADKYGAIRFLIYRIGGGYVQGIFGVGCLFDRSTVVNAFQKATSAPSVVHGIKGNSWFVAYQTLCNTIALRRYDSKTKSFFDQDLMPIKNSGNDHVAGRPAMTKFKNHIIMCWRRNGYPMQFFTCKLHDDNQLQWESKYNFKLPKKINNTLYSDGISSAPSLTHDNNKIYLAFTRRVSGGYGSWQLHLYESTNEYGFDWKLLSTSCGDIFANENSYINIASNQDNKIYVAQVGVGRNAQSPPRYNVHVYNKNRNTWKKLNEKAIFTGNPKYEQFSFIGVGKIKK